MAILRHFVRDLVLLSKKASEITRLIRQDDQILQLLIQEKPVDIEQGHFTQDFKTLADVLIQEMIKDCLLKSYPLLPFIKGEESNQFTSKKGKIVEVKIKNSLDQMVKLLVPLMQESKNAARKLALVILSESRLNEKEENELNQLGNLMIDESQLGIWIDPIDSTNEYVRKSDEEGSDVEAKFPTKGLATVTCLVGVFSMQSGEPLIGVMSLPFHSTDSLFWGVDLPNQLSCTNLPSLELHRASKDSTFRLLVGSDRASQEFLPHLQMKKNPLEVRCVSGAGYKLFLICSGKADGWICAGPTVFRWDMCAGHALLRARFSDRKKADVVTFTSVLDRNNNETRPSLRYSLDDASQECYQTGLIAFSNPNLLDTICIAQSEDLKGTL